MKEQVKYVKKVNATQTLLTIPAGESRMISHKVIKANSIRSAVRVLNGRGYSYEATELGYVIETKVTRIK